MRKILTAASLLSLSACGNVGSVISDYGSVRPVTQQHEGIDWKFYDKPEEGRMMVAPTVASVRQISAAKQREKLTDPALFFEAAQAHLAPRGCTAASVKPLVQAQMEVAYTC